MSAQTIEQLRQGHQQFKQKVQRNTEHFHALAQSQSPGAVVITCSDSRIDLNHLFKTEPGQLFVIRNIANIVPPYEGYHEHLSTKAGIEYAIEFLNVSHLIVLGHSGCGGIQARHDPQFKEHRTDFIERWVKPFEPNKDPFFELEKQAIESTQTQNELNNIVQSLNRIYEYPWAKKRMELNTLQVHGWHYDIASGDINVFDARLKRFTPLA